MATRWAVATDLTLAASWSATKGGAGGAGVPGVGDMAYLAGDSYNGPCTVGGAITCSEWSGRSTEHGGTDFTGTLTITSTITTSSTNPFRMTACTIVIGAAGVIAADGITMSDLVSLDMQNASALNTTEWIYLTGNTWANTPRGICTNKVGDGANTGRQTDITEAFYEYEVEATQAATFTADAYLTNHTSNATRIKGSIGTSSGTLRVGCSAAGTFLLDTNGDITGSLQVELCCLDGATVTWNRATAISLSGTDIRYRALSEDDYIFFVRDFLNCDAVRASNDTGVTTATFVWEAGTLKIRTLILDEGTDECVMDLATNNPSIEVVGLFNLNSGGGSTVWNRGTGSILMNSALSGSYNFNLAEQIVEDMIINAAGSTYPMITDHGTTESLTITAGELELNTRHLTVLGATDISGTLSITGADGYLIFQDDVTFQSGSVFTAVRTVNVLFAAGGDLIIPNEKIWSTNYNGYLFVLDGETCTITNANSQNRFWDLQIQENAELICNSASTQLTFASSDDNYIDGTLNTNGNNAWVGARAGGGTFRLGVNGNITGSGGLYHRIYDGAIITIDKITACGITGFIAATGAGGVTNVIICADFSNADYIFFCDAVNTTFELQGAAALKCKHFESQETTGEDVTVNNSNDKDLHTEEVTLTIAGGGTFTWNRSATATWFLTGAGGIVTIDWQGHAIEKVNLNCAGAIKELPNTVNTISLSGSGGTLRSTVAATARTINVSTTGQADNCTFKDIHMNAAARVNAKTGSTNQGNTKGIVFRDKVQFI